RPAAYTDLRKLLEDKSIDAISIATPNHSHTLQTIWAWQGRLRGEALLAQYVRGPPDRFCRAEVRAHGAARQPATLRHRPRGRATHPGWPARRRLHGPRPVLQMARHHRPQAGGTRAAGRPLRSLAGTGAPARVHG